MNVTPPKLFLIGHLVLGDDGELLIFRPSDYPLFHLRTDVVPHPRPDEVLREITFERLLGKLVSKFQALEMLIRGFLHKLPKRAALGVPHGTDIWMLPVGTELPISEITDYDSMERLIQRFNLETTRLNLGPIIDVELVSIRDALAHGRVAANAKDPTSTMRLLKFSKPFHGRVRITLSEPLNYEWLTQTISRVEATIRVVHSAYLKIAQSASNTP
ncbi:MAG: hypothetical protein PHE83_00385 [Opitutaceae bacterium]|nr:hypothetical protein [Opitutaceae bacterium]